MDKKFKLKFIDGTETIITLEEILAETLTLWNVESALEKVGDAKNGEVYEGDKLLDERNGKTYEYEAILWGVAQTQYGVMPIKFDFSEMELVK